MKIKLLLVLTLFTGITASSQVVFDRNEVTTIDTRSTDVQLHDIDNDGDLDLITGNERGFVTFQRNNDGLGDFGPIEIITNNVDGTQDFAVSDLDNDNDLDVIVAGRFSDKVSWFENTDGFGTFGPEQLIVQNLEGAELVEAGDLDGDGDNDLVVVDIFEDLLLFFENTDGQGTFGSQQAIDSFAPSIRGLKITDVDSNGTLDVLVAESGLDRISWYSNDGMANFGTEIIITSAVDAAFGVEHLDVNADGRPDIISASQTDQKIAWYENLDGNGNYGPQQIISSNLFGARDVTAADLDNDNDLDIIAAGVGSSRMSYFENLDGLGNFGPENIIQDTTNSNRAIATGDIDGDGDIDIALSVYLGTNLFWYRNATVLATDSFVNNNITIYPNPVKDMVFIDGIQETVHYTIYTMLGQKVSSNTFYTGTNQIDISNFKPGFYSLELKNGQQRMAYKIIKQ